MAIRTIGIVAHDHKKGDVIRWAAEHSATLKQFKLCATGTTGALLEEKLGHPVTKFLSGPLGGDLQIGVQIAEGHLDMLIFFWDPLTAQPHDPDVKALLRVAVLWDIPFACNEVSASFLLASPMMASHQRVVPDYSDYRNREAKGTERPTPL